MLSNNIKASLSEEYRIEERIRTSYLRCGGRFLDVVKDLHDLPKEHILKVVEKFKKESKASTNLVADKILEHILFGYTSRTTILFDTLKKLEAQEQQILSSCHSRQVRVLDLGEEFDKDTIRYECLQCGEICDTYTTLDNDHISLKISTIDQLRKEDANLGKLVESLGFAKTPKVEPVQKTVVTQIVLPTSQKQITADLGVIQDLEKLNPIEQESLRMELEKSIHTIQEAEFTSSDSTE